MCRIAPQMEPVIVITEYGVTTKVLPLDGNVVLGNSTPDMHVPAVHTAAGAREVAAALLAAADEAEA